MNTRKYTINDDYFSNYNLESSYWAGFIAADGCIILRKGRQNAVSIKLAIKDIDHLERFKECLKCNIPVTIFKSKYSTANFYISSDKIVNDLFLNYGIGARKSLTLSFPKISNEFIDSFILGYIDGDGCITKKSYGFHLKIRGTTIFLNSVKDRLDDFCGLGKGFKEVYTEGNIGGYRVSGKRIQPYLEHLYNMPVPKMPRKWLQIGY